MYAGKCVQIPPVPDHDISIGPSIDCVICSEFFFSFGKAAFSKCRLARNGDEVAEIKFHDVQETGTVIEYNFNLLRTTTA